MIQLRGIECRVALNLLICWREYAITCNSYLCTLLSTCFIISEHHHLMDRSAEMWPSPDLFQIQYTNMHTFKHTHTHTLKHTHTHSSTHTHTYTQHTHTPASARRSIVAPRRGWPHCCAGLGAAFWWQIHWQGRELKASGFYLQVAKAGALLD